MTFGIPTVHTNLYSSMCLNINIQPCEQNSSGALSRLWFAIVYSFVMNLMPIVIQQVCALHNTSDFLFYFLSRAYRYISLAHPWAAQTYVEIIKCTKLFPLLVRCYDVQRKRDQMRIIFRLT